MHRSCRVIFGEIAFLLALSRKEVRIRRLHGKLVDAVKKTLTLAAATLIGVIAGILISSSVYVMTGLSVFGEARVKPLPATNVNNAELSALAYSILDKIKDGDYIALSRYTHPDFGVLFSPQATVAKSTNKRFYSDEIAAFGTNSNVYVWGINSANGEPIEMTPVEYFARYVFYKDYTEAPYVGINHIIRSGNALENITDVFPDMQFIEFHIPGGDQDTIADVDWCTLRLGFDEYDGSLWLTAIIHSEWSI